MKRVVLGARVTSAEAETLRSYADDAGLTFYQATVRAMEVGIATLVGGRVDQLVAADPAPVASAAAAEIEALREAIERLAMRAELTDRLGQRTLFAAGAAYAAALARPGEGDERMAQIARDADRIFELQLAKAREG